MNDLKHYLGQVEEIFAGEQFIAEPHELYEPIDYTLRLGGKRIRPTLLLAANALFGGDVQQARDAALGIETFHNFTLLLTTKYTQRTRTRDMTSFSGYSVIMTSLL